MIYSNKTFGNNNNNNNNNNRDSTGNKDTYNNKSPTKTHRKIKEQITLGIIFKLKMVKRDNLFLYILIVQCSLVHCTDMQA
jgi:hypothetical protein